MRPKLYLAGPITGCSYNGATDWRKAVRDHLSVDGIETRSPMRGKEYLRSLTKIGGTPNEAYMSAAMSRPAAIVGRDRNDVMTCDAMLANLLEADIVSVGTMIEFGWADAYRKPIITVMESDNPMWHAMVTQMSTYIVPSLDEAVEIARVLL